MSRTAVIAGVGPGLGESLARRFAAEGCSVGLLARSEPYIESLASELPTEAVAVGPDLAAPAEIESAFDAVRDALGPVDGWSTTPAAGPGRGSGS